MQPIAAAWTSTVVRTALFYAIIFGRTHLLPVLCTADMLSDVIVFPHAGRLYTHVTIDFDHADALRQLLQLGCDVNVRVQGLALLTYALSSRSYACALVLLDDSRCDVNAQAHSAVHNKPLDCVLFNTRNCNIAQEISKRTDVLMQATAGTWATGRLPK